MKTQQLVSLGIVLIAIYLLFQFSFAALNSIGITIIHLIQTPEVTAFPHYNTYQWIQLVNLLIIFSILAAFLLFAGKLSTWIVRLAKIEDLTVIPKDNFETISAIAFSILGLYLFISSVPYACRDIFNFFFNKATISPLARHAEFWRDQFPILLQHLVQLTLTLLVFLKGKSLAKFTASIRKIGR